MRDNINIRFERMENNFEEQNKAIDEIKYEIENLARKLDDTKMTNANTFMDEGDASIKSVSPEKTDAYYQKLRSKKIRISSSVKDVQKALKNAGYYDGAIDGKIGAKSIKAIEEFQKDFDLKVDGVVGKKTWNQMKKFLE